MLQQMLKCMNKMIKFVFHMFVMILGVWGLPGTILKKMLKQISKVAEPRPFETRFSTMLASKSDLCALLLVYISTFVGGNLGSSQDPCCFQNAKNRLFGATCLFLRMLDLRVCIMFANCLNVCFNVLVWEVVGGYLFVRVYSFEKY